MIQQIFNEEDLPIEELERIGLAKAGKLLLTTSAVQALVSGRRTEMLRLKDLSMDGFQIEQLDAKLSLKQNAEGKLDLLVHPIYREVEYPEFLTDTEAEELQKGRAVNIWKMIKDNEGKPKDILVEFDPDTREFVITDTEKILVPDMVNNEYLSPEQKEKYRKGKQVEISDGTVFQFSATDGQGVRSNRLALVASLIIDGGVSYLLYKGLHTLFGKKPDEKERTRMSPGYKQALEDLRIEKSTKQAVPDYTTKDEYSRGYSRSGMSR
ncbi:DUF4099 domain-containing protein [Mucilaginibacter sp. UYCu711]|uniref:DUF4099 domain-containing protein n=1 Tax=Mucilaginibacter sp. UYCu711 TaxID=3156339 RepID=UPI003D23DA93